MTYTKKTIKDISVQSHENWIEDIAWRKENKAWLRKSSAIALRILDALDELNWNKAKLAQEMGVSPQQVSKYVKGEEKEEAQEHVPGVGEVGRACCLQANETFLPSVFWTC